MTVPKHKMWLTSEEAAQILTANSGHLVKSDYVRKLAYMGHIATKRIDKRTLVYNRNQVETYVVDTTPGPRSAKKRQKAQEEKEDEEKQLATVS